MKLLRGKRLLDALEEDSTIPQLRQNIDQNLPTKKRQYATGEVSVQDVTFLPYQQQKQLRADAQTRSNGHDYKTSIQFLNVTFLPEPSPEAVTVMGKDRSESHVVPIQLASSNVKVSCSCLDFHYRFSAWNDTDGSLVGDPPGLYFRRTQTRPPVNPAQVPGMCKHLIKFTDRLRQLKIVK